MKNCFLYGDEDQPNARRIKDICDAVVANRSATTSVGKGRVFTGSTRLIGPDWPA